MLLQIARAPSFSWLRTRPPGFPGGSVVKESTRDIKDAGAVGLIPGGAGRGEDPLEEGVATRPSIPAWRIPRTEEPGEL